MDELATNGALVVNPVLIFFIVLVIILLAPLLLKKLKIPHIVGMIVAGVVVGPYGFNLLDRDSSFEIFGQVGVLYLMFLAGLEIDMYHLKKNVRKGLGFGLLTFFVPMVVGVVAAVLLLDLNIVTASLLASMYASHTLIAYHVITRLGITKSPALLVSIVGTIRAILCSLLVLAITVSITHSGEYSLLDFGQLLLRLGIYCGVVLYSYPRLTRWFFKNYSDKVTQFVYVLAMVFLASWMAQVIGLEAVLGAFFAGLVLNRYIPNVSPLMSRIEFVGNALFIPYFLIGVGMMINVRVLSDTQTLLVAAHMLVVAIVGKWLAAWIAQKVYGFDRDDRTVMFGLTTAHTAVALAVVMIGYNMIMPDGSRLLNEQILNGTVVMILVTCALAPIVTSGAAARVKIRMMAEGGDDSDYSNRRKPMRTLIPVSNPVTAASLVDLALMMKRKTTDESIFALHVRNDNSPNSIAIGQNALKLAGETAAAVNVQMTTIERYDLNTVAGIVNTVNERDITDVVVGMHQKLTVVDSYLGGKIEQLIKELNKMVIITRCYIPINTITRIVVVAPPKAEFETGFAGWVIRVANLARRIGCRIIFFAHPDTIPLIRGVIYQEKIEARTEYRNFDDWGDFALIANRVLDDDLFIVISARRTSLSFNGDMDSVPGLLAKYFGHNNLLIIYPEQFGETPQLESFSDPLTSDLNVAPSGAFLHVRAWLKWLRLQRKHFSLRRKKQ